MLRVAYVIIKPPLLRQVVLHLFLVERDALSLLADDAVQAPRKQRHALCQHGLQVPFR
jgi:hypothetical protein